MNPEPVGVAITFQSWRLPPKLTPCPVTSEIAKLRSSLHIIWPQQLPECHSAATSQSSSSKICWTSWKCWCLATLVQGIWLSSLSSIIVVVMMCIFFGCRALFFGGGLRLRPRYVLVVCASNAIISCTRNIRPESKRVVKKTLRRHNPTFL